ncbi:MAG: sigma-54 dependent transcriptional regulator [candidate division KSB1 bacterium]|nr:sigma-54 dependent transcriptional regulator [candidate division KSB1 bacterium]
MKIIVADDDANIVESLRWLLMKEGHAVTTCSDGRCVVNEAAEQDVDLVFCDVVMPQMDGLQALKQLRNKCPRTKVVMISGQADISTAVNATREGAYDFLEKPVNPEKILLEIRKIEDQQRKDAELDSLKNRVDLDYQMIGESPPVQSLRAMIDQIAPTDGRVLIYGENGTGKELVAREIHKKSGRPGRFLQLNCAALPRELIESELFGYEKGAFTGAHKKKTGLIQEAENGTLLLDEIGDMAPETQAKLLRVLQENEFTPVGSTVPHSFNVRVLSATNKNLETEINNGHFRQDLYFRLNVVPVTVPALRDRIEDLPALTRHFLDVYAVKNGKRPKRLEDDALNALMRYRWPGNVRELRNVVERLSIMLTADKITASDAVRLLGERAEPGAEQTDAKRESGSLRDQMNAFEESILRNGYAECQGNVSRMAEILQTDRANLHKKLKKYGLK